MKFKPVFVGLGSLLVTTSLIVPIQPVNGEILAGSLSSLETSDFYAMTRPAEDTLVATGFLTPRRKTSELFSPAQPEEAPEFTPDSVIALTNVPAEVFSSVSRLNDLEIPGFLNTDLPVEISLSTYLAASDNSAEEKTDSLLFAGNSPENILALLDQYEFQHSKIAEPVETEEAILPGVSPEMLAEASPDSLDSVNNPNGLNSPTSTPVASGNTRTPDSFQSLLASLPFVKQSQNQRPQTFNTRLTVPEPINLMALATSNGQPQQASTKTLKSAISTDVQMLTLTVGKAQVLTLKKPATRISVSNPNAVSAVILSPTQIQLTGQAVGVANLLIWDDQNSSRHTTIDLSIQRDVSVLASNLRALDSGIEVVPLAAEDTVILTGEAGSKRAAQLAVELAKAFFSKGSGGGMASGSNTPGLSSMAPGSYNPGSNTTPNIINMIKVAGEPSTKAEMVEQLLHNIDSNIRMEVVPGNNGQEKVILTGRVKTAGQVSKAINTASIFYGEPGLQVLTGPGGNKVRNSGNPNFHDGTNFSDNMDVNILQGSVIADTSGNVVSMMEVAYKPQVRCSIKFLDVSRSALKQLGSNFLTNFGGLTVGSFSGSQSPAANKGIATLDPNDSGQLISETRSGTGTNTATKAVSQAFGVNPVFGNGITQAISINNRIGAAISALEENSKVRSLAEPTLTLLSGEKASFLAGGEVPIPVLGANGQVNVEYHEFGIRLNLIATVDDNGKIHMQIAPEVSTVDPSSGISTTAVTVPGFRTRRMQTTLELENGQSFILAGLYNQEESNSTSRFPGLGSLPVIGSFFRNKWNTRQDNELVVIIQPEVIMTPNTSAYQGSEPGHSKISKK